MWPFVPVLALFAHPIELDLARQAERAGDYARMLAQANAAYSLCPEDPACRGEALNIAAGAHYYRGEYRDARATYLRALDLYRRLNHKQQEATMLNNLGSLAFVEGRYSDALRLYDEALALNAGEVAAELTWANQAALFQKLGRDQAALSLYQKLRSKQHSLNPSEEGRVLANLGALLRRLGDPVKARQTYLDALALFARDRNLDGELGTLKNLAIVEAQDLNQPATARERFEQVVQMAERSGNRREAAQARLYLAELSFREGNSVEAVALWNRVLTIGLAEESWRAEHGLGRAADKSGNKAQARERWRQAVHRIEEMRTSLRTPAVRSDFLATRQAPYESMVDSLASEPSPDVNELLRWMERSRARSLGESVEPDSLSVAGLQSRLETSTALLLFRGKQVLWIRRDAAGWSSWPTQEVETASAWIVVPDGERLRKPLDADPRQVEQRLIWYVPAARFLQVTPPKEDVSFPWQVQFLALAAPTASSAAGRLPGDERWDYLPAAIPEVTSIAARLPGKSEVYTGPLATRAHLHSAPIVHLATHAAADPEDPARSRILLSAGDRYDYLFRQDIVRLGLRGTALVVLSACETERGVDLPGEGPQSLARAFLESGARATVATLWKVEDGVAAEFMRHFYAALSRGLTKAEALRTAKLAFLRSGTRLADPRHWGAFIVTGDGDRPLPKVVGWPELLFALGAIALIAALGTKRSVHSLEGK